MASGAWGKCGVISPSYDPFEFVRAVTGWDRLRLEAELERELAAAELACERSFLAREQLPRACPSYVNFLKRVRDWLQTGYISRQMRRETKALLLVIGEALAARGQIEQSLVQKLRPPGHGATKPPTSR